MPEQFCLYPIGYIRHAVEYEKIRNTLGGVEGYIEILPEFAEGISNIEGFSHLIVLTYLHKVDEEQRKVLKVRHRKLERLGIKIDDVPEVGVFATDSPHRPNPIGLSIVRLKKVEGRILFVEGIDVSDETPVLDIKPYDYGRRIENIKVPWWSELLEKRLREKFGDRANLEGVSP
ncbi:MAG: tRNA (N6-threonylcarbamoyladenosine(37)-N6)-methyltransferase TrmO [Desulfurococcales archaeon]|jgi:tRNA-Thr(GGU) m(6)t(6)A37 methyltransferase TsaA|uniref:tRNA (N6-threonylcarbamoyladenosine(37)-N6)-methyltransferase TrmO n=1 Tax=Fervidicoccus fontis TaxID=683846 RepID=A0A7J3SK76_9CREN|nr:tRNA (N6-threonylcarbamoyladenosine(37)-N6)-methyltransferase TrmO [Thermoprotei archaeon]NAY89779.1 tRNA (N6-threonylcarbamoyladenosine(37)-N6)-methyltransferase TrmO [Desulfurococcales archaeon]